MGSNLCRVKSGERLTRCTTVSWESIDEAFASLVLRRIGLQFNVEFWRYVEIDSGVDVLKPFVRFPLISIFINSNINSNQSRSPSSMQRPADDATCQSLCAGTDQAFDYDHVSHTADLTEMRRE